MYRWAFALFVCCFFGSVALFAFDQADRLDGAGAAHAQGFAVAADTPGSAPNAGIFGGAPVHGLDDVQPELPDVLSHVSACATVAQTAPETTTAPCAKQAWLAPDRLLRPPRLTHPA